MGGSSPIAKLGGGLLPHRRWGGGLWGGLGIPLPYGGHWRGGTSPPHWHLWGRGAPPIFYGVWGGTTGTSMALGGRGGGALGILGGLPVTPNRWWGGVSRAPPV